MGIHVQCGPVNRHHACISSPNPQHYMLTSPPRNPLESDLAARWTSMANQSKGFPQALQPSSHAGQPQPDSMTSISPVSSFGTTRLVANKRQQPVSEVSV